MLSRSIAFRANIRKTAREGLVGLFLMRKLASSLALVLVSLGLGPPPTFADAALTNAAAYTFSTFAGHPRIGSADGAGNSAQFYDPVGIAVDAAGNLYVADSGNHTIRRITPAGVVVTIAGLAGVNGSANGANGAARFAYPSGIALDRAGHVYVADWGNSTIRRIMPVGTNWVVSTIAGRVGYVGSHDGPNGDARFSRPLGIAVDSQDNVFVADSENNTIRKITPVGTNWIVSTIAGLSENPGSTDGMNSDARFDFPFGVAVDTNGNVYIADDGNSTVRKITPVGADWAVSTLAGTPLQPGNADGTGSNALFNNPDGITVDQSGIIYVADRINNMIRKITPVASDWVVSTVAGVAGFGNSGTTDGTGASARFFLPEGIAVDSANNVYVADTENSTIRKITSAAVVTTLAGAPSDGVGSADGTGSTARFVKPTGVAVDSDGNVYVADKFDFTLRKITSAGVVSTLAGLAGSEGSTDGAGSEARFDVPSGVAVDSGGNLYVTVYLGIRMVTPAGLVSTIAGSSTTGSDDGMGVSARFNFPQGIAMDSAGNLYVADTQNSTIRKLTRVGTDWVVTTIAGLAENDGNVDGAGTNARFAYPRAIAVDGAGYVYVADTGNRTMRMLIQTGTDWMVSTIAGSAMYGLDGVGTNAWSEPPLGIVVDGAGDLYVADDSIIRKITRLGSNWLVSTIGGSPSDFGSADGAGSAARFDGATGIAVDGAGKLYVGDSGNHAIRKGIFTAYAPANPASYTPPSMNGRLVITLTPPQAGGQWRFPWEFGWRSSGSAVSNLATANYLIEFKNVPGYLMLPVQPVQVNAGQTTFLTNEYLPTISAAETTSAAGSLTVFLGPTPPPGAGWRFLGGSGPFFLTGFTTNLLTGTYLIEFASVSGRIKPPSQAVQINPGQPSYLSVNYLLAAAPPTGVYLPLPVPDNQVNDEATFPFGFNGQLQSDTGYGSGVAVQTNVVLTAAHLVFNDQTLSYVSRAHWFWRRNAGVSEPLPQAARAFYVLSGYAAQRTNDLASGYSPDQSTPPSRTMDVAALYFSLPVAGGGYGGYLPSDSVPNTWLTSTALKMLVGYPVDGSQFGDVSIVPGKMYQTDPQPYPLELATDPVPGQQQIHVAPWFLSYPGNSGGPLYVQFNGSYYPAAVYLGTLFSGAQPYASIVRAIDSKVVNLINLAASQGDSGTNNTGGGVITVIPNQAVSASNPGYVQWQIAPSAAIRAGAGWRLQGDPNYSNATNYTRAVFSTNPIVIEFKGIPGWNLPTNRTVSISPGQIASYEAFYTVTHPVLTANQMLGIVLTGTTGTVYRLEIRSSLNAGTWAPVSTNTITSDGSLQLVPGPLRNGPSSFYRVVWLP